MYEFGREPSLMPRYVSPPVGPTDYQRTHIMYFQQKRLYYEVPTPNLWKFGMYQQFANGNALFTGRVGDADGTLWSIFNPNGQGTFSDIRQAFPGGTIYLLPWFGWRYAGIWDASNNAVARKGLYGSLVLFSWWPKTWNDLSSQR